ncbi:MAG TPA: phosphatase PAP2 family protein [Hanamia sp.]|nr:phosphatase PAP2 family protein [Hanamia sp.]
MEADFSIPENAIQPSKPFLNEEKFPLMVKWGAHLFSFIFHPLFIPLIATWFLAYIQPGYFTGISLHDKSRVMIQVGFNTIFYPVLTILLLKAVGFIKSIFLKTQRERIIPYITSNIFYFWMFLVFKNEPEVPVVLTGFMFGIFLTSSAGLIANIYFKISMHAMGVGALCGLMLIIIFSGFSYPVFLLAMLVFMITGLVCTSRLIVSDHWPSHIYSGIFISIICQLIAYGIFG